MRKFLEEETNNIWTLEELKWYFENQYGGDDISGIQNGETFEHYLESCMYWNNGELTEILTEDTPPECVADSIQLCRVRYSDDEDDYSVMWLNPRQIKRREESTGYPVEILGCYDLRSIGDTLFAITLV